MRLSINMSATARKFVMRCGWPCKYVPAPHASLDVSVSVQACTCTSKRLMVYCSPEFVMCLP